MLEKLWTPGGEIDRVDFEGLSLAQQDRLMRGVHGGSTGYAETLIASQVDSTALTASTTPTSILPAAARYTLPPNFFAAPGKQLLLCAMGRVSNIVTTPGTLTLDVRMGPTSNIVVFNGGAMALNIVAKTNVTWFLEILLTCRAIGNSTNANLMGYGQWCSESVIGSPLPSAGGSGQLNLPASAPAVGTGFDSTVAMVVDVFGTWSLNNANSIQTHQYSLISLN